MFAVDTYLSIYGKTELCSVGLSNMKTEQVNGCMLHGKILTSYQAQGDSLHLIGYIAVEKVKSGRCAAKCK